MAVRDYSVIARLRDGLPVRVRAVRPGDRDALRVGFHRLSERAIYHRFFQTKRELTEAELSYLTELDFVDHVGLLVVLAEADDQIIAVARFIRVPGADRAEIAFVVGDDYQGRGVATILLEHLAGIARGLNIRYFDAEVLPGNRQMLEVFEHSPYWGGETIREGIAHVELRLGPGQAAGEPAK